MGATQKVDTPIMPKVEKYMTPMPKLIAEDMPLKDAMKLMTDYRIRHLPVERKGSVIGVLSDSDVKLGTAVKGTASLKAADMMTPDPYSVRPEAPLDEIVVIMAEQKFRCVIVEDSDGKAVGIFTDNDALRALGEILRANYKKK